MYGWMGQILRIDLTKNHIKKTTLEKDLALAFIGARGINSKILYDEVPAKTDPLGPDNKLIFGTGPLTGIFPLGSRYVVTAKSPLSGALGDANSGGRFAADLKFTGFDHIVISGRASKPVYILITDDNAEIRDASSIWGKDTWETQRMLKEEMGDRSVESACIGPAGEHLVRFAAIMTGLKRAAGRTGLGAVMGSKNLKAITVQGSRGIEIASKNEFKMLADELCMAIKNNHGYGTRSYYGTPVLVEINNVLGMLITKNCQSGYFKDAEKITAEALMDYHVGHKACTGCIVHCSHYFKEPLEGVCGEGVEYETIQSFGSKCCVDSMAGILRLECIADRLGMDTIDAGSALSFAMECFEREVLNEEDTQGYKVEWGDVDVMARLLYDIAYRKALGNILAEGHVRASNIIRKGSENWVGHSKGVAYPSVEPRGHMTAALGFSISCRGADHCRGVVAARRVANDPALINKYNISKIDPALLADSHIADGKAELLVWGERLKALTDALGICKFPVGSMFAIDIQALEKLVRVVMGINMSGEELMKAGRRIVNIERLYIVREGFARKDDTLAYRQMNEPLPNGPTQGLLVERQVLDGMLDQYYKLEGWDRNGVPRKDTLKLLGLE